MEWRHKSRNVLAGINKMDNLVEVVSYLQEEDLILETYAGNMEYILPNTHFDIYGISSSGEFPSIHDI